MREFSARQPVLARILSSTARHGVERKVTEEQLHSEPSEVAGCVSLEEAPGSSVSPGLQPVFSWIAWALKQSTA